MNKPGLGFIQRPKNVFTGYFQECAHTRFDVSRLWSDSLAVMNVPQSAAAEYLKSSVKVTKTVGISGNQSRFRTSDHAARPRHSPPRDPPVSQTALPRPARNCSSKAHERPVGNRIAVSGNLLVPGYARDHRDLVSGIVLVLAGWAQPPTIGSCPVFPPNNIWNLPVDNLGVATQSSTYVNTIGSGITLHPDFGTVYEGAPDGTPYITVTGTQEKYPATFTYSDQSDPGPYAVPLNAPIEGGSQSNGDRHVVSIDTTNCILYEMWSAYPQTASWQAGSGAISNLTSNALRPAGVDVG
jgi:hypothetical protein